jgi:hypothetical protein
MCIVVFSVVTSFSNVGGYQRFGGIYHLHIQVQNFGYRLLDSTTSQPRRQFYITSVFILVYFFVEPY